MMMLMVIRTTNVLLPTMACACVLTTLPPPLVVTLFLTDNLPIGAGVVTVANVGEGARDAMVVALFGSWVALVSFMPALLPPPLLPVDELLLRPPGNNDMVGACERPPVATGMLVTGDGVMPGGMTAGTMVVGGAVVAGTLGSCVVAPGRPVPGGTVEGNSEVVPGKLMGSWVPV